MAGKECWAIKTLAIVYHNMPASPNSIPCMPASFVAWAQAKGDAAVRAAFPNATIFKPATLIGGEDRITNNIAQMGKKCALLRK